MNEIFLYNTPSRRKEPFTPLERGKVSMYACGPTVYWFAHIGNMRTYIFVDGLHRALRMNGFDVHLVMNLTDVGHLTDDADAGEDKMIVAMKREGKTAYDIAEFYAQAFFGDVDRLNILRAREYPRATAHMPEQIAMIEALEKNGFTYRAQDGIYFDTVKLAEYGRLSGQRTEEKMAGARVGMGGKRNATDFALWKFSPSSGGKREMEWDSPWGVGFPGWHIECSAMSAAYLPVPFDIHTGGVDHVAVHHENEIAQTLGASGKPEAHVWMHAEFLTVNNGKMSKSLGNLYTLGDLVERGFEPLAYRYLCLGAHYRSKLNFTFEALQAAQNALDHLREIARTFAAPTTEPNVAYMKKFLAAVNNDLDLPGCLALAWMLVDDPFLNSSVKARTLLRFDEVFGLKLADVVSRALEIPSNVQAWVRERDAARAAKDWKQSDVLRAQIEAAGFVVDDTPDGVKIKEKRGKM